KLEAATARLRQVHFQERAKAILQLGERVDGFDGASAVRPARAGARRKRDHEYLAAFERSATDALVGRTERLGLHDVARANVFDRCIGGQAILGQSDALTA